MHLQCLSTSKANTNTNLRNLPDPKPNEVFPFFKLCAELRVMILEECLVVGKVFPRPNPKDDERLDDIDQYKKPISQLLCVSRQMRREAAEIFLQKNIFVISCGPNSWPWRADFGPSTATLDSLYDLVTEHVCSLSICFDIRDAADPPAGMDRLDINVATFMALGRNVINTIAGFVCTTSNFANCLCSRGCCELESDYSGKYLFRWQSMLPVRISIINLQSAHAAELLFHEWREFTAGAETEGRLMESGSQLMIRGHMEWSGGYRPGLWWKPSIPPSEEPK
ncbi:hypothetical protein MBLNU457_2171t1 [Dothideomycetes sp. NU457]